jgi:transposase-like protein
VKTEADVRCPQCGATKSWLLKNGRRRCAVCRRDWRPGRLPLRLSMRQWREVLRWFVRGATGAEIAQETGLDRKRVLRALLIVRRALRRAEHAHKGPAPRTPRVVLIGLRVSNGRASAELVPQAEAEHLERALRRRLKGQAPAPRSSRRYMAVVYRGRLVRLAESGAQRVPFGPVEAFWAYVQRQLRAKGGIRRERLDLYLASFAWRYNHRRLPPAEQVEKLLALIAA